MHIPLTFGLCSCYCSHFYVNPVASTPAVFWAKKCAVNMEMSLILTLTGEQDLKYDLCYFIICVFRFGFTRFIVKWKWHLLVTERNSRVIQRVFSIHVVSCAAPSAATPLKNAAIVPHCPWTQA